LPETCRFNISTPRRKINEINPNAFAYKYDKKGNRVFLSQTAQSTAIGHAAFKIKKTILSSGQDDSQRAIALGRAVLYKEIIPVAM
jgi:hypothetical protein